MEIAVPLLFGVLVLGLILRLGAGNLDRGRIEHYVKSRGGRIVSINWSPFGRGWFGEQRDRIYEVVYYDRAGDQHLATCKTSVFGGVFFTEDRVAHRKARWEERVPSELERGPPLIQFVDENEADAGNVDAETARLKEENRKLRKELENLREGRPGP